MDVNKISFYPLLPELLVKISEAHFVAIDLELSGVPTKQARPGSGKQSLQERYLETKEAAERYQILQIGLTCVHQNVDKGEYTLYPYNFDLSPLILERGLEIERIFSFQSGAVEFLLKSGFDLGRPFHYGVPYLSRTESKEARQKHAKRQDRSSIADIKIKPTEVESLAFVERVHRVIEQWLPREHTPSINIGPSGVKVTDDDSSTEEMSRFEKRLVHQLVRSDFPALVTVSKRGYIQILRFDKKREDRIQAERQRELEERIARQKGFRWVVDALRGSQFSSIDLHECARDPKDGHAVYADLDYYRSMIQRAEDQVRDNPRILVGHNCFLDLVYIYRTFIGPLPDTVDAFAAKLHEHWPVIVDTKYMSTHDCGDINPISSLEQIAEQLGEQEEPSIRVPAAYNKYEGVRAYHEAGYDSYLTAQIAVRLSSKLNREGGYTDADDNNRSDAADILAPPDLNNRFAALSTDVKLAGDDVQPVKGFSPSVSGASWQRDGDPTINAHSSANDPFHRKTRETTRIQRVPTESVPNGMPRFGAGFWKVYGNKLRVFGTQETVCVLDTPPAVQGDSTGSGDVDMDGDGGDPGSGGVKLE